MDKKSIIKELYWNIDELSDGLCPEGPEHEKVVAHMKELEERLMNFLPEEGKKVFEDFMMATYDVERLQDEEIYRQGFCFGLQLTAEAYVMNRNRIVSRNDE